MKRLIILTMFLFGSISIANSQSLSSDEPYHRDSKWSFVMGPQFSQFLNVGNTGESAAKVGFFAGASRYTPLGEFSFINAELSYNHQGGRIGTSMGNDQINLGYVQLPVTIGFNFFENFQFELGAFGSLLINDNLSFNVFQEEPDYNNFDWGAVTGLSIGDEKRRLGVRYMLGLNDVGNFNNIQIEDDVRNSTIQVFTKLHF